MKSQFVKNLKKILRKLAQWTINKYRPGIIGITGSVGKTSSKIAILSVLEEARRLRSASGNFNNEIGLPLTILGSWSKVGGFSFWLKVVITSFLKIIFPKWLMGDYPELLVLEYAADRPGDIKYLLSIARPNISVITAIGDIPVHVEFFSGPEEVTREKSRLVEHLPAAGFAVLNQDDEVVASLKEKTRAHVITFGFSKAAEVRITGFETRVDKNKPIGISFKLEYGGNFVPIKVDGVFGRSHAYSLASAACIGLIFGLNLVKIAESLRDYHPPKGRMNLIEGIKDTWIIDDTYNASPLSMYAALDTLNDLPGKRKIAVLGDMTEIGKYAMDAHGEVGRIASNTADKLVTIGPRAKFIAEGAVENGFKRKDILSFDVVDDARIPVQELIQKGDLILIKASRVMGLEKIVEEIKSLRELEMDRKG